MNWISVEDRLPDTDIGDKNYGDVIVIGYNGVSVIPTIFEEGRTIQQWSRFKDYNITHWMPLPEPPEEEI